MMNDSISLPSIAIEDKILSWQEALAYLQLFGKLKPLVQELVSEYIIVQEIKNQTNLEVSGFELEQAIIDLRLQQKLTDSDQFQKWMQREGLDYSTFQQRILLGLKVKKLKKVIAEPKLPEYFQQQKESLEQVDLYCLITEDKSLVQELKNRLINREITFERAAKEYDSKVKFTSGIVRRNWLPKEIQDRLKTIQKGELVGPFEIKNDWGILQVQRFLPAELNQQLQQQLEEQIFRHWLAEKINSLSVKLADNQTEFNNTQGESNLNPIS